MISGLKTIDTEQKRAIKRRFRPRPSDERVAFAYLVAPSSSVYNQSCAESLELPQESRLAVNWGQESAATIRLGWTIASQRVLGVWNFPRKVELHAKEEDSLAWGVARDG
jgi:hypothetical protein